MPACRCGDDGVALTSHAGAVVVEVLAAVVAHALLGVAEHAVSLAHFLESPLLFTPLHVRSARVPVRVVYQGALPATYTSNT